jgi:hypothetical protein
MTDESPDPDSAEHTRERQDLGYEPEVLAEPIGGPVPRHEPIEEPPSEQ